MALKRIITDLVTIITALKEALRGRTIDLSGTTSRARISLPKLPSRMKSAEMKKSAEWVRREIRSLRRTLCMRKTKR